MTLNIKVSSRFWVSILLVTLFVSNSDAQQKAGSSIEKSMREQGMVDVYALDTTLIIDMRYATTNNFTHTVLYDSLKIAYLHPVAAKKLVKAHSLLKKLYSHYRLIIFDVARPLTIQKKMYQAVENTRYAAYVANPSRTSLHNYGMAVDLSICDLEGIELDMGTPFDFFGSAAGINQEEELIGKGVLTRKQVDNRKLLRGVMERAGFSTIRGEWWHFNAISLTVAKTDYKIIQ